MDHPGVMLKLGLGSAQLQPLTRARCCVGDSRWTSPASSAQTCCEDLDVSLIPMTPSYPLPQNPSQASLLGFTGNFLRSVSASEGPVLLNSAPQRRAEVKCGFLAEQVPLASHLSALQAGMRLPALRGEILALQTIKSQERTTGDSF